MSDEAKKKLGASIKAARKGKKLTQKELGERMGLTTSVITNYEAGKQNLTVDTLDKIANALGLNLTITFD